jgi:hypothetical protein
VQQRAVVDKRVLGFGHKRRRDSADLHPGPEGCMLGDGQDLGEAAGDFDLDDRSPLDGRPLAAWVRLTCETIAVAVQRNAVAGFAPWDGIDADGVRGPARRIVPQAGQPLRRGGERLGGVRPNEVRPEDANSDDRQEGRDGEQ